MLNIPIRLKIGLLLIIISSKTNGQNWEIIKTSMNPVIEIPAEYDSLYRQPLATLGWEDGVHISNDGLNLYCTYVPIDFLSFVLNGALPNDFSNDYLRGAPTFGMDLTTNPIGATEWLHSDILYAHKNSTKDAFTSWTLSNMARPFYSEGAPTPMFGTGANLVETMLFTSNDNATNNTDIWLISNTEVNPVGVGTAAPAPINTLNTEDNPHLVRIDDQHLVLFFDSENLPNGKGDIDIWFSESTDNGTTWSIPSNCSSVNTVDKEHQPFLHFDISLNQWFLYFSAIHTDGKLAIFRAIQQTVGDWDSWGSRELVISAGNTAGIGEPTLTTNGDISFVVVYADPNQNSIYNHYDSDPWFLRKGNLTTGFSNQAKVISNYLFPNPTSSILSINTDEEVESIKIYDCTGKLLLVSSDKLIDVNGFQTGLYYISIQLKNGTSYTEKLIKE